MLSASSSVSGNRLLNNLAFDLVFLLLRNPSFSFYNIGVLVSCEIYFFNVRISWFLDDLSSAYAFFFLDNFSSNFVILSLSYYEFWVHYASIFCAPLRKYWICWFSSLFSLVNWSLASYTLAYSSVFRFIWFSCSNANSSRFFDFISSVTSLSLLNFAVISLFCFS